jgi:hypothetical protein
VKAEPASLPAGWTRLVRDDACVTASLVETEAFIRFRLLEMSALNEHHRFEEIATRVAQKRISANILIATGPVSSKGDQGRDAESFTTHIPDELPHSAGFAAAASTAPVVVACTLQKDGLKQKVLDDLAGICHEDAAHVEHVAFFSAHPISEGVTHELQTTARETHGVTLNIFCGADIATFLAEEDLVWVAEHYLQLPSHLVPEPRGDAAPAWYTELLDGLRQNKGPAALTAAAQGGVAQGLRHATWDEVTNSDLPEWLDYMGAFLADTDGGTDSELVFRACYEMAVARFRGQGVAAGVEDLVRRAVDFAVGSDQPDVIDRAVTLVSYWGVMWSTGVARAEAAEIADAMTRLRDHADALLDTTDTGTHPVRAATLTGTLAVANLTPNWKHLEHARGKPEPADVAPHVGVKFDAADIDTSDVDTTELVDLPAAMEHLDSLVDLLPRARPYSVSQLAEIFDMFAPVVAAHPSYPKVRDGLDATLADIVGDAAAAERCRNRAMSFARAGRPLEALTELHDAKVKWFNGETMYGSVLTMRYIAHLYANLNLTYAAKMYACTAAALAVTTPDDDVKEQTPKALLEVAGYAQRAGTWVDAAGLTEIALLARAQLLPDPFDFDKHPDLSLHHGNAALELAAVRAFWPDVEPILQAAHHLTDWFDDVADIVTQHAASYTMTEEEVQAQASEALAGPILADLGPTRTVDFQALGVRWILEFDNDRRTVLTTEAFTAVLQIVLADLALHHPVLIEATVRIRVVVDDTDSDTCEIDIDESAADIVAVATIPAASDDLAARTPAIVSLCFQLLHAVHVRPPDDLQAVIEPMFKAGLAQKVAVGRPYEETADLLDDTHYRRCADAHRPASSATFQPSVREPLGPSTQPGAGYDQAEALSAIRERYEVANDTLRYTLPRLLMDEGTRQMIEQLRADGWLDWQILAILVNVALNWRLKRDRIQPQLATKADMIRLIREPESESSPRIPLEWFGGDQLAMNTAMCPITCAQAWRLRPRQREPGRDSFRDLLVRRYRFAQDDISHLDLLASLDADGRLLSFLDDTAADEER